MRAWPRVSKDGPLCLNNVSQQMGGKNRSLWRFFMLEVSENITPRGFMSCKQVKHAAALFGGIVRLSESIVDKRTRSHIWSCAFLVSATHSAVPFAFSNSQVESTNQD